MLPADLRDLLLAFNQNGAEYLIVGVYALAAHAEPRATKDLDIFIRPSEENSKSVFSCSRCLRRTTQWNDTGIFCDSTTIFQIGVEPNRIGLLQKIDGVSFDDAWRTRIQATIGDALPVFIISRELLIQNKLASG